MHTVTATPVFHRGQDVIALKFTPNHQIESAIRKLKGIKWTQTHKAWYLPFSNDNYQSILNTVEPLAKLDDEAIKEYLQKKKKVRAVLPRPDIITTKPVLNNVSWKLSNENLSALKRFVEELKLKAYSPSTIKTYRNELLQLLQILKKKEINDLTPDDLRRYFLYCFEKLKLSENTLHSRINAVKFYFEQVLKREKFFWEIPRPKKAGILPKVLSENELSRLFNAATFLKHKAILFTAYSAGLRVSEVIRLKWKHIDRQRSQILIEQAKGKKDRYVTLSPVLEDILTSYYRKSKLKPKIFVFESGVEGQAYSQRSAQAVFQMAKQKAGIKKEVGFHSLRHSFATHLLEKGTDVRFIQELLGHFSIKTTTRYLHVAKEKLVVIESPLDSLWKHGGIDWDG